MKLFRFLFFVFPVFALGQQMLITGNVLDDDTNEPLPGATIIKKNTSIGTISDFDGNFELNVRVGDTLVFSFVGLNSQELLVLNTPVSVRMQPELNQLNEVQVSVVYFDLSKKDLSGAITQIGAAELEKNRTNSIESLLQGQSAGVVISESSEPGAGIGVSIRGVNSMLGGTQPLYVLDGIPVGTISDAQGNNGAGQQQNSLGFLNPNDIEKIEILKDAAATSLYGARGANGVVVITTKTADRAEGVDRITLNVDTSVSQVIKNIDVLDGLGFENYMNQRFINQLYKEITNPNRTGGPFDGTQEITLDNYPELADLQTPYPQSSGVNTNWQDVTYSLAYTNAYNLNYRGGNFKRNLSISLRFLDQQGVIVNSNNKRLTYNMNAKRKAFDNKIDFFSKTNISYKKGNAASVGNVEIFAQRGVVSQTLQFQPISSLLSPGEEDDIYAALNEGNIVSNPYTLAKDVIDLKKSVSVRQVFSIVGKLAPKLTATVKASYDYRKSTLDKCEHQY